MRREQTRRRETWRGLGLSLATLTLISASWARPAAAEDRLTLRAGETDGVRVGMTGRVCYDERIGDEKIRACAASFEVLEVSATSSVARITRKTGDISQPGILEFDQVLVPPNRAPRKPSKPPRDDAESLLDEAERLYDEDDWLGAAKVYEDFASRFPGHSRAADASKLAELCRERAQIRRNPPGASTPKSRPGPEGSNDPPRVDGRLVQGPGSSHPGGGSPPAPARPVSQHPSRSGADVEWMTSDQLTSDERAGVGREAAAAHCFELIYDGHDDWRLPYLEELFELFDPEVTTPLGAGHVHVEPDVALSASRQYAVDGFYVNLASGEVAGDDGMHMQPNALCVRGAASPRFGRRAPGVLGDHWLNLEWTQDDNERIVTWSNANRYCQGLVLEGRDDWRLPTIDELESLAGNPVWFDDGSTSFSTSREQFWSSSAVSGSPGHHWSYDWGAARDARRPHRDAPPPPSFRLQGPPKSWDRQRAVCVRSAAPALALDDLVSSLCELDRDPSRVTHFLGSLPGAEGHPPRRKDDTWSIQGSFWNGSVSVSEADSSTRVDLEVEDDRFLDVPLVEATDDDLERFLGSATDVETFFDYSKESWDVWVSHEWEEGDYDEDDSWWRGDILHIAGRGLLALDLEWGGTLPWCRDRMPSGP